MSGKALSAFAWVLAIVGWLILCAGCDRPAPGALELQVEGVHLRSTSLDVVFVRVTNRSNEAVRVPGGNPPYSDAADLFELYLDGPGDWHRASWDRPAPTTANVEEPANWTSFLGNEDLGLFVNKPSVELPAGKSELVLLPGYIFLDAMKASYLRVVLRVTRAAGPDGWSGAVSSQPYPIYWDELHATTQPDKADLPDFLPAFSRARPMGWNMYGNESQFRRLVWYSNGSMTTQLERYRDAQVATAMERRMAAEEDDQIKLYEAVLAARAGSTVGRDFILHARKRTDREMVVSTLDALMFIARTDPHPQWAVEALKQSLTDDRKVIAMPEGWGYSDAPTIREAAGDLFVPEALQRLRSLPDEPAPPEAAKRPVAELCRALLESASAGGRWTAAKALEAKGDASAVPALLQAARKDVDGDVVLRSIFALGSLRSKAAVEALIACFDIDFSGKSAMKIFNEPWQFQDKIARCLRGLTGQNIGADPARWRRWWEREGRAGTDLP
ncbi:MAG: hypothetical protein BIFFINMI_01090 [Phycisphaerae bacterium]|nr:hypothetical protein [Phycisphaerae bacterium]